MIHVLIVLYSSSSPPSQSSPPFTMVLKFDGSKNCPTTWRSWAADLQLLMMICVSSSAATFQLSSVAGRRGASLASASSGFAAACPDSISVGPLAIPVGRGTTFRAQETGSWMYTGMTAGNPRTWEAI